MLRNRTGVLTPAGAHRLDDGEAVDARQHAVDDQQLVALVGGERQAFAAVGDAVDDMAVLAQPVGDVGGGIGIVLDQQDLHVAASRVGPGSTGRCHPIASIIGDASDSPAQLRRTLRIRKVLYTSVSCGRAAGGRRVAAIPRQHPLRRARGGRESESKSSL